MIWYRRYIYGNIQEKTVNNRYGFEYIFKRKIRSFVRRDEHCIDERRQGKRKESIQRHDPSESRYHRCINNRAQPSLTSYITTSSQATSLGKG